MNNLNYKTNTSYKEFYNDLVINKSKFDLFYSIDENLDDHLSKTCFFFTAHFGQFLSGDTISKQIKMKQLFHDHYKYVCSKIMINDLDRNLRFLPFCIGFYDVEMSRKYSFNTFETTPHYHGVILIHPKNLKLFENMLFFHNSSIVHNCVDVSYKQISRPADQLINIVQYSSKYSKFCDSSSNFCVDFILPEIDKIKYPFYKYINDGHFGLLGKHSND